MEKNREPGNKSLNACAQLTATLWTGACQSPLSMGFSRQEYWKGLPCPPPGDLPDQESNLHLLCLQHCRRILYPLSHLGNSKDKYTELQAGNVIRMGLRIQFVECFLMSCAPPLVLALSGLPFGCGNKNKQHDKYHMTSGS